MDFEFFFIVSSFIKKKKILKVRIRSGWKCVFFVLPKIRKFMKFLSKRKSSGNFSCLIFLVKLFGMENVYGIKA